MKYGCVGEHLRHSFSKEIHGLLADYEYELFEIAREELDAFAAAKDFCAVNVTIPYKESIMPHLFFTEDNAKRIGAVNTVVNRDGRLYGYNTDFFGMCELIRHAGIEVKGKKAVILGTGGTSKTAYAVLESLGVGEILKASRTGRGGAVSYEELYSKHTDAEIIVNTTPVGMFPNGDGLAAEVDRFPSLSGVIDAVYNPLRTRLIIEAQRCGIPAEGGLYMLVAQAVKASEIFTGRTYPAGTLDAVYERMLAKKQGIVLTGMPSSGKSTVGGIIAERLGMPFYDTDALIVERLGMSIPEIFRIYGEGKFRDAETEVIKKLSPIGGAVIATGGGAVLRRENVDALKQNGKLYFIDRPLESLTPTEDRPLASGRADIERRYKERYSVYCDTTDVKICADKPAEDVAEDIINLAICK